MPLGRYFYIVIGQDLILGNAPLERYFCHYTTEFMQLEGLLLSASHERHAGPLRSGYRNVLPEPVDGLFIRQVMQADLSPSIDVHHPYFEVIPSIFRQVTRLA